MKKPYLLPLILFAVFFVINIVLMAIFSNISSSKSWEYFYAPAIFIEIAIFGCIIIYLINKRNDDKNDDDDGGTK